MQRFRLAATGVALGFVAVASSQEASHEWSRLQSGLYPLEMRPVTPVRPGTRMGDRTPAINPNTWTFLGPAPIVNGTDGQTGIGRIVGIAPHPTDANTIYVAAAGGGVWKTTNGGSSWVPLIEGEVTQAMGAIALAPSNPSVIYAATGEDNSRGILVSSDAGTTWTLSNGNGALDGEPVYQIAIHPTNPDIAYVATRRGSGWTFHATGIYKTTDRGVTWTVTTTAITTSCNPINGFAIDFTSVQIDPSQPSTVYAAAGPAFGCSSASNGIYKSVDGGANWNLLLNAPHGAVTGRTTIAVSKSNSQVVYVTKANGVPGPQFGMLDRFLRSDDGGATFTDLTAGTPNYFGTQGNFDMTLVVDPGNPAIVYAGGGGVCQDLLRSTNSGASWDAISNCVVPNQRVHVDHHGAAFDANGRYLDGNDGGIFRLNNPSPVQWADLNGNLSSIQFYGIALHPTDPHIAFGGSQDNGTDKYTGTLGWTYVDGADGGLVRFSPTNVNRIYHNYVQIVRGFARSDDGGTTWQLKNAGLSAGETGNFQEPLPPFVVDPGNGDRVLWGSRHVWETVNGGDSWTALGAAFLSNVHALALAPSDPNVIYAAAIQNFGPDQFWVTTNHGTNWTARALPLNAFVGDMQVSPSDPMTAYFVDKQFDTSTNETPALYEGVRGRVFKTTSGGTSWTDLSGNLSRLPVWSIQVDWSIPGRLFVGTSDGVYVSNNDGSTWNRLGTGLPRAVVYQIEVSHTLGIMGAATYGRGLWEIGLSTGFTDALLTPGMPIKAVHITELRTRIDALRAGLGLAGWNWTDPTLTPGVTTIRAQHVGDLRAALNATYGAAGRAAPAYADANLSGIVAKAVHINDIRLAIASLESTATPEIVLRSTPATIGAGLQFGPFTLRLSKSNHGGVTVHLASSGSNVLLSPNASTSGSSGIDLFIPDGVTDATYFVQGASGVVGSGTITASASGFTSAMGSANVVQPALSITGLPASMAAGSGTRQFEVNVGLPTSDGTGVSLGMAVRAGSPALTATVTNSNGAAAQLVPFMVGADCVAQTCTTPVLAGLSHSSLGFQPLAAGSATVSATIPGFITTTGATRQVTITP